jgi:DNA-binding transcriptional ArsR family regulator
MAERVFRALGDANRLLILELLHRYGPMTIQDLAGHFPTSRFAVMKHLNTLEAAGLLRRERDGNAKLVYLQTQPLRVVRDGWLRRHSD